MLFFPEEKTFIDKNLPFGRWTIKKTALCVNEIMTTKYGVRCRSLCE